ncbi:hypothetical protein IPM65_04110 [Candidatus Roizmanbacteria bacterium]|nr:MAG: hypothetical protein IPM65_04110 [Candidatus Roizmanbacteria bacterium]
MVKLNSKQLRDIPETEADAFRIDLKRNPIYLIVENVYDTYNIGGLFRLADGLAVTKLYLCGEMETPPHHKIEKASVGTYKIVPWEYKESAIEAIEELRAKYPVIPTRAEGSLDVARDDKKGVQILAVEQSDNSKVYTEVKYAAPVALIVGNETFGVTAETLAACDHTVEIPMWGINKSLNVIVSAAIVAFHVMEKIR